MDAVSKRYLAKNKLFGVPAVIVGTGQKAWLISSIDDGANGNYFN